ncbi:MAG: hypothetical protein ACXWV5_02575 [Flavitalea sp.]
MTTPLKTILLISGLYYSQDAFTQLATVDDIRKKYEVATSRISGLYNGPKYQADAVLYDEGTPFLYPYLQPGSVHYDGSNYEGIELLYDLVKDELVLLHFNGSARIQLVKPKVSSFTIAGRNFINVDIDKSKNWGLSEGYYEVIHKGKFLLLKKNIKLLQTSYTSRSGRVDVFDRQKFYLVKDGKSNQVSGRKDFLSLLGNSDIDSRLRKSGITYRSNQEEYMKQALKQTEQPD